MFSLNNLVTTSTCDAQGRLKLYAAFQMLQDCSELWVESEPAVRDFFATSGMTQLLASRQVQIDRVPRYGERLTTVTSVYGVKPMFGFRNTFILDAQGQPCYRTWSMGAFVDRATGRLQRIPAEVLGTLNLEPKKPMDYADRRIVLPHEAHFEQQAPVAVTRNDIDYNGHMNNANYIRIAAEYLPADFTYANVRVEFKRPARLGQELVPSTCLTADGAFLAVLALDGAPATLIEFK